MGNGATFTNMEEFTDAAVLVIGTMCPSELAATLAVLAEIVPESFQFAVSTLEGTVFEHHECGA